MKGLLKFHLLIICLINFKTYATHIVGGEIFYRSLSGNNYEINLSLYRDCYYGVPPFDNPANITIFDSNGNIIQNLQFSFLGLDTVNLYNYSGLCVNTPTNVCIEKTIYCDTVNLPPIIGGYTIVYQRCCRSAALLNVVNPGSAGATYWAHIPGSEIVSSNNSPKFSNIPPFYFCNNLSNVITYSAADDDGDSLSYFLSSPYDGIDGCCPIVSQVPYSPSTNCSSPPVSCPTVNVAPPYLSLGYSSGYSSNYPISSSPAISINVSNGLISLTPNLSGDFVIGLGIKEYRNHTLIGTYYQDFHTKVVNCDPCTSIMEYSNLELNIFPNPLSNSITIKVQNQNYDGYYILTDLTGKIILKDVISKNVQSVDVKDVSKGIYFLNIYFNNNLESVVKKVIIE